MTKTLEEYYDDFLKTDYQKKADSVRRHCEELTSFLSSADAVWDAALLNEVIGARNPLADDITGKYFFHSEKLNSSQQTLLKEKLLAISRKHSDEAKDAIKALVADESLSHAKARNNDFRLLRNRIFYSLFPEKGSSILNGTELDKFGKYLDRLFLTETKAKRNDLWSDLNAVIRQELLKKNPALAQLDVFGQGEFIRFMARELKGRTNKISVDENISSAVKKGKSLNRILYGPPGTGKTYHVVNQAVEIIDPDFYSRSDWKSDKDRKELKEYFDQLVQEERVRFVTFHQSYGYEQFVEGLKAKTDNGQLIYDVDSGIFKKVCEDARESLKSEQQSAVEQQKKPQTEEGNVSKLSCPLLGMDNFDSIWEGTLKEIRKNSNLHLPGRSTVLYTEKERYYSLEIQKNENGIKIVKVGSNSKPVCQKEHLRAFWEKRKEIGLDIREVKPSQLDKLIPSTSGTTGQQTPKWIVYAYMLALTGEAKFDIRTMSLSHPPAVQEENSPPYVLIIDEINRGNISKIFGELITLIEDSKRLGNKEFVEVRLPYSGKPFSVPKNLFIIGTMNTADRSLALMDTALRRRFEFTEMMPDLELLKDIKISVEDEDSIDVCSMVKAMNERIGVLYDREHTLGHAFFLPLKKKPTLEHLSLIFRNKVFPLLEEYFYEDWQKIRLILGDGQGRKKVADEFIIEENLPVKKLFGGEETGLDDSRIYKVNLGAFEKATAYRGIYAEVSATSGVFNT